jgi:poly(hydroxyalkanoate) depolymerase family esterase
MLKDIGPRIRNFLARIFRRAPPAAGYFVKGHKMSLRGWLHVAPWLWPSREYLLYVPRGYGGWKRRPLVVMIHGCKQTPEEFAAATRITRIADERGWLVLLPRQTDKANSWSCWNWFDEATSAGRGEAAIVAAQIRAVRRHYRVHRKRIVVAGFSAGGALATALAVRHPNLFAGAFVHSGIACGAASGASAAANVMRRGTNADPARIGSEARARAGGAVRLPVVILHGDVDSVVAEINASQVARQFLALNGYPPKAGSTGELPPPDAKTTVALAKGRTVTTSDYRDGRRVPVRMVRVTGLDHAWSGGDPAFPYNDPKLPDATQLLGEFLSRSVVRLLARS